MREKSEADAGKEKSADRSCDRKAKSLGTLGTVISSARSSSTYHAFLP